MKLRLLLPLVLTVLPAPARPGVLDAAKKNVKGALGGAEKSTRGAVDSTRGAVHSVVPSGWTEKKWKEERTQAKEERKGLAQYQGPRNKIRAVGTKVAAMPMKATGVEPRVVFIADDLLLTELFNAGFDGIGPDDINDMLGFETTKEKLGSDDSSQLSEVGGALGVKYLTSGGVSDVDGGLFLSLKLIDVESRVEVTRVNTIADEGVSALPRAVAEAVQKLVAQSGL